MSRSRYWIQTWARHPTWWGDIYIRKFPNVCYTVGPRTEPESHGHLKLSENFLIYDSTKYMCVYKASQVVLVVKNLHANAGDMRD